MIFRTNVGITQTLLHSRAASSVWVFWDGRLTIFQKRDHTGPFRVPGIFWG